MDLAAGTVKVSAGGVRCGVSIAVKGQIKPSDALIVDNTPASLGTVLWTNDAGPNTITFADIPNAPPAGPPACGGGGGCTPPAPPAPAPAPDAGAGAPPAPAPDAGGSSSSSGLVDFAVVTTTRSGANLAQSQGLSKAERDAKIEEEIQASFARAEQRERQLAADRAALAAQRAMELQEKTDAAIARFGKFLGDTPEVRQGTVALILEEYATRLVGLAPEQFDATMRLIVAGENAGSSVQPFKQDRVLGSYPSGDLVAAGPGLSIVQADGSVFELPEGQFLARGATGLLIQDSSGNTLRDAPAGPLVKSDRTGFLPATPPPAPPSPLQQEITTILASDPNDWRLAPDGVQNLLSRPFQLTLDQAKAMLAAVSSDVNPRLFMQMVAAGGLNMVAAGAGNMVAAGGMNLVAAGGLNFSDAQRATMVAAGGLNFAPGQVSSGIVAAGGLNANQLIGLDGSTFQRMVAAGAGNMVAAGAGNLVAAASGNLAQINAAEAVKGLADAAGLAKDAARLVQPSQMFSFNNATSMVAAAGGLNDTGPAQVRANFVELPAK